MNWSLFNPFQKFFCILSILLLSSQGFMIYQQQYNKNPVNLSCPQIPEIPAYPKPQKIDLSGLRTLGIKLDVVIKSNKKLDQMILKEQRKIDKILKAMTSWGIDR